MISYTLQDNYKVWRSSMGKALISSLSFLKGKIVFLKNLSKGGKMETVKPYKRSTAGMNL